VISFNLLKFGETLTDNADGNPEPRLMGDEMRLKKYNEDQLRHAEKTLRVLQGL
jgi:hypothetical protein